MGVEPRTVVRQLGRWAAVRAAVRVGRSVPFLGTAVAIGLAGDAIRRKGFWRGLADTGIDAIPFVGAVKNGIEIFTGDWIKDRSSSPS